MTKQMIDDVYDLVDITIRDMFLVTRDYKTETVNICFGFFEKPIEIKLQVADIVKLKNSAKGFFKYLREKITEGLKERIS